MNYLRKPLCADLDRSCVLRILKAACNRCADFDYAFGKIIHEEDVRASVYGYARTILDMSPAWRVFCNMSAPKSGGPDDLSSKPDLIFFHSLDDHQTESVEIIVEFKHWPSQKQINNDIEKLIKLGKRIAHQSTNKPPAVVFFAILGDKHVEFRKRSASLLERRIRSTFSKAAKPLKLDVWFRLHHELYCGPWNKEEKLDPWRICLRRIRQHP